MVERVSWTLATCLALVSALAQGQEEPGLAIYHGRQPIAAHLRGDTMALPAAAAACSNCHETGPQVKAADAALGPRLDERLKQPTPRRGGPESAYSEAAFCGLLRSSVDPAGILVRRAMPQYELSEADCHAVWMWVSERAAPGAMPTEGGP